MPFCWRLWLWKLQISQSYLLCGIWLFVMYLIINIRAIPTYRVYRLYDRWTALNRHAHYLLGIGGQQEQCMYRIIPSETRSLLGVRSNLYGFAEFLKPRLWVLSRCWLSLLQDTLLRSFPTPPPTDNSCRTANEAKLNSTRATTFAPRENIASLTSMLSPSA